MAMAKTRVLWWVEHPQHAVAVVIAPNWELATVEAAKWWDVPWGKVAAECSLQKKAELPRNVCAECGNIFYGRDGDRVRCAMCEATARSRESERRAAEVRYWREMTPRKETKMD